VSFPRSTSALRLMMCRYVTMVMGGHIGIVTAKDMGQAAVQVLHSKPSSIAETLGMTKDIARDLLKRHPRHPIDPYRSTDLERLYLCRTVRDDMRTRDWHWHEIPIHDLYAISRKVDPENRHAALNWAYRECGEDFDWRTRDKEDGVYALLRWRKLEDFRRFHDVWLLGEIQEQAERLLEDVLADWRATP
jgi:hypothetical protein